LITNGEPLKLGRTPTYLLAYDRLNSEVIVLLFICNNGLGKSKNRSMHGYVTSIKVIGSFCLLGLSIWGSCINAPGKAYGMHDGIILKDPASFLDNKGRLNIIGVIDNDRDFPVEAIVGVNVTEKPTAISGSYSSSSNNTTTSNFTTFTSPTFARVIYPGTGAPFKIVLGPESEVISPPFVYAVKQRVRVNYDVLNLNYSNMAIGSEKALIGTVTNTAPFPVYDATVYASVHDSKEAQVDSAISEIIPRLGPGQEVQFKLVPDPMAKSSAVYYSCAGVDLDAPISTLATSDGGFIPFDLQALAKIIDLKYEEHSNSIVFGVDHYNPEGGMISLKVPQTSDGQKPTVIMDGLPRDDVKITSDGKTIRIDLFIPPNQHEVQIKGVSHVT